MASNPTIEDFFLDDKPAVLDSAVEGRINKYIENYALEIERNEARAYEESLKIFLNC